MMLERPWSDLPARNRRTHVSLILQLLHGLVETHFVGVASGTACVYPVTHHDTLAQVRDRERPTYADMSFFVAMIYEEQRRRILGTAQRPQPGVLGTIGIGSGQD